MSGPEIQDGYSQKYPQRLISGTVEKEASHICNWWTTGATRRM